MEDSQHKGNEEAGGEEKWQAIDWAIINRLCAPIYRNSKSGQRSWAPAQLFALLILFFVLSVPSECALLRLVAIVPLYRWFCGFGIFTTLPDHSTLYDFRKNVGVERFEAIMTVRLSSRRSLGRAALPEGGAHR